MSDNPLARALDAAGDGPEARAYNVPVEAVRRGVRRRRAWRTGGVAALALVVVGGAAGGVAAGTGAWRDWSGGGYTPAGDWPGQFARCGEPLGSGRQLVLPDVPTPTAPPSDPEHPEWALSSRLGPVLEVQDGAASLPADGVWTAHLVTTMPPWDQDKRGWFRGVDLTVVRDGVVVGVQRDGPQVPAPEQLDDVAAGTAVDAAEFPMGVDVELGLASCETYPSGDGSPSLAPGTYDLMVTQTFSYGSPESPASAVNARVSTWTTVTITDDRGTTAPPVDATTCGTSDDLLAALASPEANPWAFPIDGEVTGEALVGLPLPMRFSIPDGAADFLGDGLALSTVVAVLTQDGVVVGDAARTGEAGEHLTVDVPVDCRTRDAAMSEPEGGFPLRAGDYEVWLVMDVHPTGPEAPDAQVAGGPWPVTLIEHPTPGDPPTSTGYDDPTTCGTSAATLAHFAEASDPAFRIDAVAPAAWPHGERAVDLSVSLVNTGADELTMSTDHPVLLLARGGRVVGGTVLAGTTSGRMPTGQSVTIGVAEYPLTCEGTPPGTLVWVLDGDPLLGGDPVDATDPLPAGDYELWVSWGWEVTAPSHGINTSVGGPWPIRLG